jgi:hypothetical protein
MREDDPKPAHDDDHDEAETNQPVDEAPAVGDQNDATLGRGFEQPEPIAGSTTTDPRPPSMWERIVNRLTGKL